MFCLSPWISLWEVCSCVSAAYLHPSICRHQARGHRSIWAHPVLRTISSGNSSPFSRSSASTALGSNIVSTWTKPGSTICWMRLVRGSADPTPTIAEPFDRNTSIEGLFVRQQIRMPVHCACGNNRLSWLLYSELSNVNEQCDPNTTVIYPPVIK